MKRRNFVKIASTLPALGLVGCLGDSTGENPPAENDESPTPESTSNPTPEPDGPSYEFEGSGEFTSDPFSLDPGLVAVDYVNDGNRHYAELGEAEDEYILSIINESHVGGFDGTGVRSVSGGEYRIYAEGLNWKITVRQPRFSEAEYESLSFETSGTDSALIGPFEFDDPTAVTISGKGTTGVTVDLVAFSGSELAMPIHFFNDEGEYEQTGTVEHTGPALLHVQTTDPWSISVGDV